MVNEAKQNKNICQIPPKFKRLSWWKNRTDTRYFILLGYWYCDDTGAWRIEQLEYGKTKSIIHAESDFQKIVDDRLMIEVGEF